MTFKLLQELKEPSVIYGENPEDPNNPEVLVKGVGRYLLKQVEKNVEGKLKDLAQRVSQAKDWQDWKTIQWMVQHAAMNEMIKTIVVARAEIEARKDRGEVNESHEPNSFDIDGYTLRQEEEYEDDNMKIWHFVQAPGEKEVTLDHTPYEYLTKEDFAEYVAYHKKHGEWPGRRPMRLAGSANWDRDSLKQMNRRLGPRFVDKAHTMLKDKI